MISEVWKNPETERKGQAGRHIDPSALLPQAQNFPWHGAQAWPDVDDAVYHRRET